MPHSLVASDKQGPADLCTLGASGFVFCWFCCFLSFGRIGRRIHDFAHFCMHRASNSSVLYFNASGLDFHIFCIVWCINRPVDLSHGPLFMPTLVAILQGAMQELGAESGVRRAFALSIDAGPQPRTGAPSVSLASTFQGGNNCKQQHPYRC
jgi:hypothetical protein